MILPGLRSLSLLRSPVAKRTAEEMRTLLDGTVLVLPAELPEVEREDVVDLVALFFDRPVTLVRSAAAVEAGTIALWVTPVEADPVAVDGAVQVAVRRRVAETVWLEAPQALRAMRDAIGNELGVMLSDRGLQRVAAWLRWVADTPSTALRFASGVLVAQASGGAEASDASMFLAGLSEVIGWLLRGVDTRVAEWVLARATGLESAPSLVSSEAAILGEVAALRRGFEQGLMESLPTPVAPKAALRRPFTMLGELDRAPGSPSLADAVDALRPHLSPAVHHVLVRATAPRHRPLGLPGPQPPSHFVGRIAILQRLTALVEPSETIRTVILQGVAGIGKTSIAGTLARALASRMEPIWAYFGDDPLAAMVRLADAMGVRVDPASAELPVPAWVVRVHDALRARRCLLVVDEIDGLREDDIGRWLPEGEGAGATLVLSRRSLEPLQASHAAVVVPVGPLSVEEGRELLSSRLPKMARRIREGDADRLIERLDGHPLALALFADSWARGGKKGLPGGRSFKASADVEAMIGATLKSAFDAFDSVDREIVWAAAICAPEGSPAELVRQIAGRRATPNRLAALAARALILRDGQKVRLHAVQRGFVESWIDREKGLREDLEGRHAGAVAKVWKKTETDDALADAMYEDLILAVQRATARCKREDRVAWQALNVLVLSNLAYELIRFSRREVARSLSCAIAAFRAILSVHHTKDIFWARAQSMLGIALSKLPKGDRTQNLKLAQEAYEQALTVWTRKTNPYDWAVVKTNLACVLAQLPSGAREENKRAALEGFRAALTVHTREAHPRDWALLQHNLGLLLQGGHSEDGRDPAEAALSAFKAALKVFTRSRYPQDWAMTQRSIALALLLRRHSSSAKDLLPAVRALRQALTVFTRERLPSEWANTQSLLGEALLLVPSGDPVENHRRAVEAFRAALTVLTPEAFPREHAAVVAQLERALAGLHALSPTAAMETSPSAP